MDADFIRLILLILGIALVAGIWLWDRWQRGRGEPPMAQREVTPPPAPEWDEPEEAEEEPRLEAEPVPDDEPPAPSLYLDRMDDEDREPPPVAHRPAWLRPEEPVIPAFVMAAPSEPLHDHETQPTADAEPVIVGNETAEPKPAEPSLNVDDDHEPEIPVLELEAEPIHVPARPARGKSREPAAAPRLAEAPVSIRTDDEQFDLDLGFSAVDEQDLAEIAADLPQLIVLVNIVARSGQFSGEQILAAMDQVEMQAGEHNIFHRRDNRGRGAKPKVLFSLASMVEPGSFPLKKMKDYSTPGLTLFAQLPGPRDGLLVYSDMLYVAERLVRLLDARLKDEQRSTLTKQTIEHTRERIAEHKRQITLKLRQAGDRHRGRR